LINKTSTPIRFADDTSILFAQPNLTDLNNNIHTIFETLNKWFKANQLALNFNKTHYFHFATMRHISTKLKIDYNNNFVTSTSCTKFLGMKINETLSWDNHTEAIVKKIEHGLLYKCQSLHVRLINKNNLLCLLSLINKLRNHILGKFPT
jgi:hypothetical protein